MARSDGRRHALGVAFLGLASLFVVAYGFVLAGLGTGPQEFAYWPFTPRPLPYAPMRGFTYEQLWGHVARVLLLTPACVLGAAGLHRVLRRPVAWERVRWGRAAAVAGAVATLMVTALVLLLLRGRAIVDDELVYAMQAAFLSRGRLADPGPGFLPIVGDIFSVAVPGGYTGKYLFGEPVVQILGVLVGTPALLHVPIFALTLLLWYRQLAWEVDAEVAAWATLFLAASPMVLLTTATGLTQASSLGCIVAAGFGITWARRGFPWRGGALLGVAMGACFAVRPQAALPAGCALALALVVETKGRSRMRALVAASLAFLAPAASILAYNQRLTGAALKLPWFLVCPVERYGFGRVWATSTFEHDARTLLENLGVVAVRWNAWWLGLPLSVGVMVVWLAVGRPREGLFRWGLVAIAVLLFEAGYYSTGPSDTGPIYHYEVVLGASVLAATTLREARRRFPGVTRAALFAALGFGWCVFAFEQVARIHRLTAAVHGEVDAVLAALPPPALVLYEFAPSEVRHLGWWSTFPKRWRRDVDPIVTYPRPPPAQLEAVLGHFRGRACFYVHRTPDDEVLRAVPCEAARVELTRPLFDANVRGPLWVVPTAFRKTSFDPFRAIREDNQAFKDAHVAPCCVLDEMRAAGATVDDRWRCIP